MNMIHGRVWRLGLAAALGLSLSLGAGATAFANDTVSDTDSETIPTTSLGLDNIYHESKGSLTVHKRLLGADEQAVPATGQEVVNAPGTALAGIQYKVTKLKFNVGDQTGYKEAVEYAKAYAGGDFAGVVATGDAAHTETLITDANGEALFANLPLGLYIVEESIPEDYKGTAVTVAAPFALMIPGQIFETKEVDGEEVKVATDWNYNVHVYPKNSPDVNVKTVTDSGMNQGDTITYTIKFAVPSLAAQDQLTKFNITDDMDEEHLSNWEVTSVTDSGNVALIENTDYTITEEAGGTNPEVKVEFTPTGIDKLVAGHVITVTIEADVTNAGAIKNKAIRIVNTPGDEKDTTTETNEVVTYEGKVKVVKTGISNKPLAGAKFELYRCVPADSTETAPEGKSWSTRTGITEWKFLDEDANTADVAESIQTLTTDEKGEAESKALHFTDVENHDDTIEDTYCLVETVAPAGYKFENPVTSFKLTRTELAKTEGDVVTVELKSLEIKNQPDDTPGLPLTGGAGIALLVGAGVVIGGAAVVSARRNSKKAVR